MLLYLSLILSLIYIFCCTTLFIEKKNSFTADTVEEEPVPEDNFCFQSTETFTTNVEKKKKVSNCREGETNGEFLLTFHCRNLKQSQK